MFGGDRRLLSEQGNRESKYGTTAGAILGPDAPAMRFDDAAANREPEPDSSFSRRFRAIKFVEDAGFLPDGNSRPSIRDFDDHFLDHRPMRKDQSMLPEGAYFTAFSKRLITTCSRSTPSICTSGRSGGNAVLNGHDSRNRSSSLARAAPTISSSGCHSFLSCTAPASIRIISRRFLSSRSKRSASR